MFLKSAHNSQMATEFTANNSSSSSASSPNKYKYYLIDKLLSDQPATNLTKSASQHLNGSISKPTIESSPTSHIIADIFKVKKTATAAAAAVAVEDNEDVVSETGTYTIDESPETAAHNKPNNENYMRQSSSQNIDLVSARAAIDETFGIVIKRPEIDSLVQDDPKSNNEKYLLKTAHNKARMSRQRNKTYNLSKDLLTVYNLPESNNLNNIANSSFSASSSSSISSYSNDSKMKKTTTYDVLANLSSEKLNEVVNNSDSNNNNNNTQPSTSRTVCTDILLGDTEKLMEELKKKQSEKKQNLKAKLETIQSTNTADPANGNLSSSSTSSSSTNLSNDADQRAIAAAAVINSEMPNGKISSRTWTIPSPSLEFLSQKEQEVPNNNDNILANSAEFNALSTRATVDFGAGDLDNSMVNRGGGMAFDIPTKNTNSVTLSAAVIQKLTTTGSTRSASVAAYRNGIGEKKSPTNDEFVGSEGQASTSRSSNSSNMTLMRKFELQKLERRQAGKRDKNNNNNNSNNDDDQFSTVSTNLSQMNSAKSGVSLGAKIQTKAKENVIERRSSEANTSLPSATASSPSPYTNRTLYLRQQAAAAKRESLERRGVGNNAEQVSSSWQQTNGAVKPLNKSVTPLSRTPLSITTKRSSSKAAESRPNSRTSSPLSNVSNYSIMSSSMIMNGNNNSNGNINGILTSDVNHNRLGSSTGRKPTAPVSSKPVVSVSSRLSSSQINSVHKISDLNNSSSYENGELGAKEVRRKKRSFKNNSCCC